MTKRKTFLAILLGLIVTLLLSFAVACGGEVETETVKWTINDKEHVTVTVDGASELPTSYEIGETLSFKVVPANGYEVSVRNNREELKGTDGVYSIVVKKGKNANDIIIEATRTITSVAVTTNPATMTYYAGQELDKTGMVVTVSYATGESEAVTDYTVVYPSGDFFMVGDTSFTVKYKDFTSAAVELTAAVEVKIVINPVGGVIDEAILTEWAARTDIKGYTVDEETGIISFTYTKLENEMALPTNEQILLGDGTSSSLAGWVDEHNSVYSAISTLNNVSLTLNANWNVVLVDMQKMELVLEEDTPYLALTMSINTDFSAYAYFFEGNKKIEVRGDEIQGKAGETVTAKIDLTKLKDTKSVEDGSPVDGRGAWIDIRVNTTINGIDVTQQFVYDPEDPIAEIGQMIHDEDYCYRIRIDHTDSGDYLKICFNDYRSTYFMDVKEVEGKPTLVMNGQANTKLAEAQEFPLENAKVEITFGTAIVTGTVKADGSWEATLDLTTVGSGFNAVASTAVMTSADELKTFSIDLSSKLDLIGCGTIFDYNPDGGNPRFFQTTKLIKGFQCTIGGDWNEPFLIVKDVDNTINEIVGDIALRYDNDEAPTKVYYVVTVKVGKNLDSADTLKTKVTFGDKGTSDLLSVADVKSLGDGVYELLFDVTERTANGSKLYVHLYLDDAVWNGSDGNILDEDSSENGVFLTLGEKKYSIANEWSMPNLVVNPYDANTDFVLTSADLVVEENKVYYVLTGKMPNATDKAKVEEYLTDVYADLQKRGDDWYSNVLTGGALTLNDDFTWTIKFDITNIAVHGNPYTGHFGSANTDVKIPAEGAQDGKSVSLNGKKYTLVNKYGATDEANNWGCVSVLIENETAE